MKKLFVKIKIIFFKSKFDKNLLVKDPLMQGQKLGEARGGGQAFDDINHERSLIQIMEGLHVINERVLHLMNEIFPFGARALNILDCRRGTGLVPTSLRLDPFLKSGRHLMGLYN
jgi:hypothetical protein